MEREVSNAEVIPYAGGELRLINVNDLIAHKVARAEMFKRNYGLKIPLGMDVNEAIERANIFKENLELANLEPMDVVSKIAYIRMFCDIADIKAVAKNAKIDEKYIQQALAENSVQHQKDRMTLLNDLII